MSALDKFGKPLTVGSRVAYAALNYRSAVLREGEVMEVREETRPYSARTHFVRIKGSHDGVRRWFPNDNVSVVQ